MTKDLNELLPIVKQKAQQLIDNCKAEDITIIITGTYRTAIEQDNLFLQPYDGKDNDADGKIDEPDEKITNAKAGQSFHNWRVAFDCVPIVNKIATYNDNILWGRIAKIGGALGLEWGGSWASFPDKPHFQYTLGYTLEDFQKGKVDLSAFNVKNIVSETAFLNMQKAILNFQLSEGITDFEKSPLKEVGYGDRTIKAASKYKK